MNCTAPCFPPCEEEATHEIISLAGGSHLGFNCTAHSKFCASPAPGSGKIDYRVKPLVAEVAEPPQEAD